MNGNCTAHKEAYRYKQRYFNATARAGMASPFTITCEGKKRVKGCRSQAPKLVKARMRHMHRELSAYTHPMCALCGSIIWHTSDSLFIWAEREC